MLWLALHLPHLPLEVHCRGTDTDQALAVIDGGRILAVNSAAAGAGVHPGLGLAAARSLAPSLMLLERHPAGEARALRQLADWALQFTSQVSCQAPDTLLLELGGSLRLFGGLTPLLRRLEPELAALGYRHQRGTAPTPVAAWLLARNSDSAPITDPEDLHRRLAALPASLLPLDHARHQALSGLGIRTLGELMALPARDLGNRLGKELLSLLERALGRQPDPRPRHHPARHYRGRLEFPTPAEGSEAVLFALHRLLQELAGLLRGLETGVQQLDLRLEHRRVPATRLQPGLMRPSRSPAHLLMICRERLEQHTLPAPVTAIELRAEHLLPLPPEAMILLESGAQAPEQHRLELIERLRARLGEEAVGRLATLPEHRPEKAWRLLPPDRAAEQRPDPHRPLWLLSSPRALRTGQGLPHWQGPLLLCHGPERIETGWWDGEDICRDYYRARAANGALLWIYQDRRRPGDWYLHGFFG
ncbi:MAG: DNA polymerase Y family protein [Ectothiorhodospiraceae bacterium]|nr:DNA polymerase Y family protein [Ectothiorhodospiraceae bacterium]